ncbi:MAG: GldG family protein [Magnetococcus sp. DMHC-8]
MNMKGSLLWLAVLAPLLILVGGVVYSVTGELGNLPLALIWVGLLALLLLLYARFTQIRRLLTHRSTQYGANMAFMIAVFVVLLGVVGAMSVKYKVRVDLTADKRYSLSQQTVKLLKSLDRDVEAIAFYREDERTRQEMVDLLREYAYHSPRFKYWFVDPDKRPAEAAKYGVTSYRTTLLRLGEKQETIVSETEGKVTNALIKVLQGRVKTLYFAKGHGENGIGDSTEYGYANAKKFLEQENYQVRELLLVGEEKIPKDADLVIVSGPRSDLAGAEMDKLAEYLHRGGSLFFLLDPAPIPTIIQYLQGYGFEIGNDIVVDKLIRIMGTNYLTPVVMDYDKEHPITRDMTNIYTFFPIARSVEMKPDPEQGRYLLARTSSSSWARSKGELKDEDTRFDPELDRKGPIGIMAVATVRAAESGPVPAIPFAPATPPAEGVTRWGKLLVLGDSNFASNTHIQLAGNRDLFLNGVNWLAKEEAMISIRPKEPGVSPLTLTNAQGRLVFWVVVIILPSLFLAIGVGVVFRRRWAG